MCALYIPGNPQLDTAPHISHPYTSAGLTKDSRMLRHFTGRVKACVAGRLDKYLEIKLGFFMKVGMVYRNCNDTVAKRNLQLDYK